MSYILKSNQTLEMNKHFFFLFSKQSTSKYVIYVSGYKNTFMFIVINIFYFFIKNRQILYVARVPIFFIYIFYLYYINILLLIINSNGMVNIEIVISSCSLVYFKILSPSSVSSFYSTRNTKIIIHNASVK